MECPVVSFEMGLYVGVTLGSLYIAGLCSCIAGEFSWYVLLWNLLALGWWLVSV